MLAEFVTLDERLGKNEPGRACGTVNQQEKIDVWTIADCDVAENGLDRKGKG